MRIAVSALTRAAALAALLALPITAWPQVWDHDSGVGNVRWSTKKNWSGDAVPANDGTANLSFGDPSVNGTGFSPDMDANWSIYSLSFSSFNPASYNLRSSDGYTLTIQAGGITNFGALTHSISNAVALGANQTWNAMTGALNIEGQVANNGYDLTVSGSGDVTINGIVSGTGGLFKNGIGNLTLSRANTYSGDTIVNAGTLTANNLSGSATGSGNVIIGAGGLLTGPGFITGPVQLSGRIAPGLNIGSLTTGAQTWNPGGGYQWQISDAAGAPGSGWDAIAVNGGLNIAATPASPFTIYASSLTPVFAPGPAANFDPNFGYSWRLLTTSSGVSGFDPNAFTLDLTGFANPFTGSFSLANIGSDLFLNYNPVPEPSTPALLGLAVLVLLARFRFAPSK